MLERNLQNCEMDNDPTADRNRDPSEVDNNMNVDDELDNDGQGNNEEEFDEVEDGFDEEFGPQEFSALNNQLDQLQTALDSLESRNDDIHSKLLDLLRSSREIRQVMTEENMQTESSKVSSSGSGSADITLETSNALLGGRDNQSQANDNSGKPDVVEN